MNELDLFAAAVAIAERSERDALLDRECSGRPELRERLKLLLDQHAQPLHLLDRANNLRPFAATVVHSEASLVGGVIGGRYKLLEQIGEGGMGTVWVAEQSEPVRRKVALKLIKPGMDSKAVLARFEAERQALAMMDHPNIAKVLDGGLTDAGRPFFVMEYVKGVSITDYCDSLTLSVEERLKLFIHVCSAVQHAHQKGIIHRDLKPSNILVAPYDDQPVPKVIDFGLAKALHQRLTERTIHTAHETVIGTPLYMSPEQTQLNNLDVDTRSDIYSLGVLLYELLTGTTPLEKARFKEAAWDEMRRIIRDEEPPRPSTRLSSTGTLPALAACRKSNPAKLTQQLRGELDWIVMKALEKERTRRYETATGLAKDVQRYLHGEAVEACPPTLGYRLRKVYHKHRAAIVTLAAFATVLLVATGLSLAFGIQARRAERNAAEEAEASSFLLDTFLGSNDEDKSPVGNVPFKTVLDRTVKRLDRDTRRSPVTVARIRGRIGRAYATLGRNPEARKQLEGALAILERELGPNDLESLDNREKLALSFNPSDKKSQLLLQDVLERRRQVQGGDHPRTIETLLEVGWLSYMNQNMQDAENSYRQALKLAVTAHGDDSKIAISCKLWLASHLARTSQHDETVQLTRQAVESAHRILTKDDPMLLHIRMSEILYRAPRTGTPQENRELAEDQRELLPEFIDVFGDDHPRTLVLLDTIALCYNHGAMFEEADPYSKDLLAKTAPLFERDSYELNRAMWIRGTTLLGLGRVDEAKSLFEEALMLLGDKGQGMRRGTVLVGLGECHLKEQDYELAAVRLSEGYKEICRFFEGERLSPNRRNHVVRVLNELIEISQKLNKPEDAEHWRLELRELRL